MLHFCFRVHVEGRDIIILPNQYIKQNTPSTISQVNQTDSEKLANKELPDENNNDRDKGRLSHGDGQETDLKDNRDDDRK